MGKSEPTLPPAALGSFLYPNGQRYDLGISITERFKGSQRLADLGLKPQPITTSQAAALQASGAFTEKIKSKLKQGQIWYLPADPTKNENLHSSFIQAVRMAIVNTGVQLRAEQRLYMHTFQADGSNFLIISRNE